MKTAIKAVEQTISDAELVRRAQAIHPVVKRGEGFKLVQSVGMDESIFKGEAGDLPSSLNEVARVTMKFPASKEFDPTMEDVLPQIPQEFADTVQAFWICKKRTKLPDGDWSADVLLYRFGD